MKLLRVLVSILTLSLMGAGPAIGASLSGMDPGAGGQGFTLMGGYDGSWLAYSEKSNGATLDRDYGYLNGIYAQARYEGRVLWTRVTADYSWTDSSTYDGAIQTLQGQLTPFKNSTKERINLYEADLGFKLLNVDTSTLTPYAGIGYRIWWRGADALPDYIEKYRWYFASAGFNYVWRINRLTAGADVAGHIPFNMKMTTNAAGLFQETQFTLKKRVGFTAQLPLTYDIYSNYVRRGKIFLFATPYYQFWPVGGSEIVVLNGNVLPSTPAREPDSRTDVYGADIGLGLNF